MHSNLSINNDQETGILYITATPIGNMEDITFRAVKTLNEVDLIAAEDTRQTKKLLNYYHIDSALISYHEHNESSQSEKLLKKLLNGSSVALVSDAGTPSVSDPGYKLIKSAIENNIKVIPIPGVSASITALSVSGFPTDEFTFSGFPSKKKKKRIDQLLSIEKENRTIIFYNSPKRIQSFIHEIIETIGDKKAILAREMTKSYEEFIRGTLLEIDIKLKKKKIIKGECTLIIFNEKESVEIPIEDLIKKIKKELETSDEKPSMLAKKLAKKYGISKKIIYSEIVKFKDIN